MPETPKGGEPQKPALSWSQPKTEKPPLQQNLPIKSSAPTPASKSSAGTYAAMFLVGLIIGVLAGWGFTSMRGSSSMTVGTQGETGATGASTMMGSTTPATSAALQIPSPQASGYTVAVGSLDISVPTWVVVYDDNNGTPGNALGAELFAPQSSPQSGAVELLRATAPGHSYFAGESLDNGSHVFSLTLDKVMDASGKPLLVEFQTN